MTGSARGFEHELDHQTVLGCPNLEDEVCPCYATFRHISLCFRQFSLKDED